jgi:hypothetical protein
MRVPWEKIPRALLVLKPTKGKTKLFCRLDLDFSKEKETKNQTLTI